MNDYSSTLYSEKSPLATYCYDLIPLTYEERGMLPAKKPVGLIHELALQLLPSYIPLLNRATLVPHLSPP